MILLSFGLGLTSIVERPSAAVTDLARSEFTSAAAPFERWVRRHEPRCVAFLGKTAYQAMMGRGDVAWGRQDDLFAGALAWVLPNPSGRNRTFGLQALVTAYSALRVSAEAGFGPARDAAHLGAVDAGLGAASCA
jgi:TDG/mug DNA glycosylase family protein